MPDIACAVIMICLNLTCSLFQSAKAMNLSHSYAGFARKSFGTPSYPSPLDRIRTGKGDRAAQLGLTPVTFLG